MYNGNKNIHQFKAGIYSRYKQEWKDVGERRIFARSKWEHYYAIYLDSLRKQGQILDWEHETKEFWFDKIKRGVRSYKPDFLVLHKNGEEEWIEVKGYMDAFLVDVDRQTAVLEQSNRPEFKQREADKQYQGKVVNEYLDNGNDARLDLIPQRNYRGIRGKLQEFMGALGF